MSDTAQQTEVSDVVKTVTVNASPEDAFRRFTDGIGGWWPISTHSLGQQKAVTCEMEGRVGGRLYEIHEDGTECLWGTVLRWDSPRAVCFSWHVGREESMAQRVDVEFEAVEGGTRLTLTHTGWELLGDDAERERADYDSGWEPVLARYAAG